MVVVVKDLVSNFANGENVVKIGSKERLEKLKQAGLLEQVSFSYQY